MTTTNPSEKRLNRLVRELTAFRGLDELRAAMFTPDGRPAYVPTLNGGRAKKLAKALRRAGLRCFRAGKVR